MRRRRLDLELLARGLVADPEQARRVINDRRVLVDGAPALKGTTMVALDDDIRVMACPSRFASRGGDKLDGALDDLRVDVRGMRCLDAGCGSGGFCDCLLVRGAREVVAVDVGYGQFDWRLRNDPRVRLLERTNVRLAAPSMLGDPFDLVVADLSFISLRNVLGGLLGATRPSGDVVLLVKPQFEAPPEDVGAGGIVRDPRVWEGTLRRVAESLADKQFEVAGVVPSRLPGAAGNREFFLWARRDAKPLEPDLIRRAIESLP